MVLTCLEEPELPSNSSTSDLLKEQEFGLWKDLGYSPWVVPLRHFCKKALLAPTETGVPQEYHDSAAGLSGISLVSRDSQLLWSLTDLTLVWGSPGAF